jgi:hypothetical protein
MHPAIIKSFGGLSAKYYMRQFIFGLIFPAFMIFMSMHGKTPISSGMITFMVISSLLYPYARFVYESVVDFIMGENLFFVNALLMLIVKFIMMVLCWAFALFIAPIGLLYLYFYHSKQVAAVEPSSQDRELS